MTSNVTPLDRLRAVQAEVRELHPPRKGGTPHTHRDRVPGCFRCELSADEVAATTPSLGVEQVIDRDTYTVQVDASAVLVAAMRSVIAAVRADHVLLARLASHTGSTTPVTEGPPAETVARLVALAKANGVHLVDLDVSDASDMAQSLDEAALEPARCDKGCDDYAIAYGLCGIHADGVRS